MSPAPWVPWPAPRVATDSASVGNGSDLLSTTLWLAFCAISIKVQRQLKIPGLVMLMDIWCKCTK